MAKEESTVAKDATFSEKCSLLASDQVALRKVDSHHPADTMGDRMAGPLAAGEEGKAKNRSWRRTQPN